VADALRAVAERVERGESFPVALRQVASEIEERSTPGGHIEIFDEALGDDDDIDQPWEGALAKLRNEVARP
jgi:hypothetical protein